MQTLDALFVVCCFVAILSIVGIVGSITADWWQSRAEGRRHSRWTRMPRRHKI